MGPKKGPQKWTQKLAPKVDRKAQVFRILVAVFWRHVCSKSDRVLGLGRLAGPTSSTAYFGYSAGASPAKPVSAVQPAAGRAKRSSSPRSLPFSKQQAGQAGTLLTPCTPLGADGGGERCGGCRGLSGHGCMWYCGCSRLLSTADSFCQVPSLDAPSSTALGAKAGLE